MKLTKQKTGLPFIIFLIVATALFAWWFLKSQNKQTDTENQNLINLDSNLSLNANNSRGGVVEDKETKIRTFQNLDDKFKVILSENATVKETSSEGIYTVHLDDNKISVMDKMKESEVKGSITTILEENIVIDGVSGTKIAGSSAKDGSEINIILVKKDEKLYYFQGTDDFLERMTRDFTFTN